MVLDEGSIGDSYVLPGHEESGLLPGCGWVKLHKSSAHAVDKV